MREEEIANEAVPIGPMLDGLGVEIRLRPEQKLEGALVLGRVVDLETGCASLVVTQSDGLDWMLARSLAELGIDALKSCNGPA